MIDAAFLGGVVGECAAGSAELVVEGDAGCECEQSGRDACGEVAWGAGAVALEAEQVFAGLEDGLDALPDRGKVRAVVALVAAGGTDDGCAEGAHGVCELPAGVALVADDRLAAAQAAGEQRQRDLALGPVGCDEGCCAWGAVGGTKQVQAHAPEPARVASGVAVAAAVGELRRSEE